MTSAGVEGSSSADRWRHSMPRVGWPIKTTPTRVLRGKHVGFVPRKMVIRLGARASVVARNHGAATDFFLAARLLTKKLVMIDATNHGFSPDEQIVRI